MTKRIGSYSFFTRASDGSINLVTKHPRNSGTWHWCLSLTRRQRWLRRIVTRAERRTNQWHDYLKLPFGWALCLGQQDYHKTAQPLSGGSQ